MSEVTQSDVAVVGAGPAGSLAAFYLARQGYSVRLIHDDRQVLDRVETLSPRAQQLLEYVGLTEVLRSAEAVSAPLVVLNGWSHAEDSLAARSVLLVSRRALVQAMHAAAHQAGATLLSGCAKRTFQDHGEDRIALTVARGSHSELLRSRAALFACGRKRAYGQASLHRCSAPTAALEMWVETSDRAAAYLWACDEGWCFSAPARDGSVYVMGSVDVQSAYLREPEELARRLLRASGRAALHSADIRGVRISNATSYFGSEPVQNRALLVGDSFLAVDPITSSGIYVALLSAVRAALLTRTRLEDGRGADRETDAYLFLQQRMRRHFSAHVPALYARCQRTSRYWNVRRGSWRDFSTENDGHV